MALKEDYLDDILDTSVNAQRKYRMITNADGTISLEDVTEYSQNGDNFGAFDINITNKTVNELIAMGLNVRCNLDGYLEVFINGLWEQTEIKALTPKTYLYKQGVFNTDLVSGWSTNDYQNAVSAANGGIVLAPTLTLNDETFSLYAYNTRTDSGSSGMYATDNVVNLSGYNSINVTIPEFSRGNTWNSVSILILSELKQNYDTSDIIARKDITDAGTFSLDISSISSGYVAISVHTAGAPLTVTVSDIWLE